MRANVAVTVIDRKTATPIQGAVVTLGTSMYTLNQASDPNGRASFIIDVGGGEAGRHPEEGIPVSLWARKTGYETFMDRFMCFGNQAVIAQLERM